MRLRRPLVGALPALVLAGAALLGGAAARPAAAATPACQVNYTIVNSWPTGFQASVDVTDNTQWFQRPHEFQAQIGA